MALQQWMGLLPKWTRGHHPDCVDSVVINTRWSITYNPSTLAKEARVNVIAEALFFHSPNNLSSGLGPTIS